MLNATGPNDPHPFPPKHTGRNSDGTFVEGEKSPAQFQKGDNTVQLKGPRITPDGRTLAAVCREYTYDAVQMLVAVVQGEEHKVGDRLKAAETLLDRGWGKATTVVHMDVNNPRTIRDLSREELQAIAHGEDASRHAHITYENEAVQEAVRTSEGEEIG